MIKLKGKFTDAIIYSGEPEYKAIKTVQDLIDSPVSEGSQVRIMPDYHQGAGCVIGTTMTIKDKVCPNLTGVDLNCGVSVYELGKREIDNQVLEGLDNFINEKIPSGRAVREGSKIKFPKLKKLKCFKEIDFERAQNSIGTLGGKL